MPVVVDTVQVWNHQETRRRRKSEEQNRGIKMLRTAYGKWLFVANNGKCKYIARAKGETQTPKIARTHTLFQRCVSAVPQFSRWIRVIGGARIFINYDDATAVAATNPLATATQLGAPMCTAIIFFCGCKCDSFHLVVVVVVTVVYPVHFTLPRNQKNKT